MTAITGQHEEIKSNDDVKQLMIKKQACPYLPLNIGSFFKNLEIFYVMNSNVYHLLKGDLEGLTQLKIFDVSHNPIEQLGRDFFEGHASIEVISFYDCHLKLIDPTALDPLKNLSEAYFNMNSCIDFSDKFNIDGLKVEIRDKCHKEKYKEDIFFDNSESSICASSQVSREPTSFVRNNAYVFISLLSIFIVVLGFVLVKTVRSSFDNNWHEFRNVLVNSN